MTVYFDTSALLKLIVKEPGSAEATSLWNAADVSCASLLAYPEARAALASAQRSGRLGRRRHRSAVGEWNSLWAEVLVMEIDPKLAELAGELAEIRGLRGYDAMHLAAALRTGTDSTLATWDRDLASAARAEGLRTFPV